MFEDDEIDVRPSPRRRFWTSRRYLFKKKQFRADKALNAHMPESSNEELIELPDPDDFLPAPPKPPGPLNQIPDIRYLRPALILLLMFFAASLIHWSYPGLSPFELTRVSIFRDEQWWRLVTALFVHADMGHLAANTPLFLIFGWFLHAFFNWWVFPLAAIVVGALSNLITIYLMKDQGGLVGASGMLYGMVAMWMVLYIRFDTDHPLMMRVFRATGASILLMFPTTFHATTSYTAHGVGFLIGIIVGLVSSRLLRVRNFTTSKPSEF